MKGALSAQNALRGSETKELLEGTEENKQRVIDLPSRHIDDFFYKKETEKIEYSV